MLRGYVHKVKYPPVADQRAALSAWFKDAGEDELIYTDFTEAVSSLRKGDVLGLGGGLHILANTRDKIEGAVDRIQRKGCEVLDVTEDRITTGQGVSMMASAWRYVFNMNRFGDPKRAARKSVKVQHGELHLKRADTEDQAGAIFWDTSLSIKEADQQLRGIGWNIQAARRYLKRDGKLPKRKAGRPSG